MEKKISVGTKYQRAAFKAELEAVSGVKSVEGDLMSTSFTATVIADETNPIEAIMAEISRLTGVTSVVQA